MEWIASLLGTTVGLDTAPLIYFIERNSKYLSLLQPFFEAIDRGEIQLVTSTLTLTEVLVHPLRFGNRELAFQYSQVLLNARNVTMLDVTPAIASEAAAIRAEHGLRTPDALQIATALAGGAKTLLTNDGKLSGISELRVIVLDNLLASQ